MVASEASDSSGTLESELQKLICEFSLISKQERWGRKELWLTRLTQKLVRNCQMKRDTWRNWIIICFESHCEGMLIPNVYKDLGFTYRIQVPLPWSTTHLPGAVLNRWLAYWVIVLGIFWISASSIGRFFQITTIVDLKLEYTVFEYFLDCSRERLDLLLVLLRL
jgi:hypothetical protein